MAHDVFISYATEDKKVAEAVCHTLEEEGIRCWIAPRDVDAGQYGASLLKAIAASRVMVLVLSAHSNASDDVLKEVVSALNRGVTVVPLRFEDGVPSGSMEFHLTGIHWLDALSPPLEEHLNDLVRKVEGHLGAERHTSAPPKKKPSRRSRRAVAGGAVMLLLASILVGAWWFWRRQNSRGSVSQVEKYIVMAGLGVGTEIAKFAYHLPGLRTDMSDSAQQILTLSLKAIRFENPEGLVDTLAGFMSGFSLGGSPGSVTTSLDALLEIVKPLEAFVQHRYGQKGTGLFKLGLNVEAITRLMVYCAEAERFRVEGKMTPQQSAEVSMTLRKAADTHQGGIRNSLRQSRLPPGLASPIALVADSDLSQAGGQSQAQTALVSFLATLFAWPER